MSQIEILIVIYVCQKEILITPYGYQIMFQKTPCISGLSLSKVFFAAQIEPEKWPSACQITLLIRVFASQRDFPKFHYIPQCFRDSKMFLYTTTSITTYQQPVKMTSRASFEILYLSTIQKNQNKL